MFLRFGLLLLLGFLVLTFLEEVEPHDEFERTIVVGKSKVTFSVVIGMKLEHHTCEIMGVVPEKARLGKKVGTEILQSEFIIVALGNVGFPVT